MFPCQTSPAQPASHPTSLLSLALGQSLPNTLGPAGTGVSPTGGGPQCVGPETWVTDPGGSDGGMGVNLARGDFPGSRNPPPLGLSSPGPQCRL